MCFCSICVSSMLDYKLSMFCIADRNKDLFVCLFVLSTGKVLNLLMILYIFGYKDFKNGVIFLKF